MTGNPWQDEEADVNDARPTDHIYPRLHGTGGIGPGTWKRGALAAAQEQEAGRKLRQAAAIVRFVQVYPAARFDWLVDSVSRLL